MKKTVLMACILVFAALLVSCAGSNINDTKFLNELVEQKTIQKELEEQNMADGILTNSESNPIAIALGAGERFFGDVFTSNDIIWHFMSDGAINAYENESKIHRYTYELSYQGADFTNKYIELVSEDGSVRKFRFKKIAPIGFDAVHTNSVGNDTGVYTFMRSSFYSALFERQPYFDETFYESNVVWKFKSDGTLKAYDVGGDVYDYVYDLTYSDVQEGVPGTLLTISANTGIEEGTTVILKIVSFTASQFSCLNVTDGEENATNVITFTKSNK